MRRTSAENGHADPEAPTEEDEVRRLLETLAEDGAGILREARRLAVIERERLRVGFERTIALLAAFLVAGLVVIVLAVAAGLRALDGLSGALGDAFGEPWAGDLAGGGIALVLLALAGWGLWTARARSRLAAVRAKLEDRRERT